MAGTLVIDTLKASTGVLATQNGMSGIPKAWICFNGTGSGTIYSSFNVSSLVVNGTADYTINYSTALPNSNYAVMGSCWYPGVTGGIINIEGLPQQTTTYRRVYTVNMGGGLANMSLINCAMFAA